jgi:hypothetical protein
LSKSTFIEVSSSLDTLLMLRTSSAVKESRVFRFGKAPMKSLGNRYDFEVIIIGGGIAGASLAYFLTERGVTNVALLERESQPGYHATGRSAASLVEFDPIPAVQRLKAMGGKFLRNPPGGFAQNPLLRRSPVMLLFRGSILGEFPNASAGLKHDGIPKFGRRLRLGQQREMRELSTISIILMILRLLRPEIVRKAAEQFAR